MLARILTGLVILGLWEFVVRAFAPAYVAKPTTVLLAIPRVIVDPAFLTATGITLASVAEGLAISIVLGTLIGLLIGRSVVADRILRLYINFFNAMPMVVVLPLVSLWFGYTGGARLATVVFAAIFSIILNTADGARAVPREHLEVANSFRSTPSAHHHGSGAAGFHPLHPGGPAARRRARADRRRGGRVLPRHRRARLLHPFQLAHIPPQRGRSSACCCSRLSGSGSS